MPAIKSDEEESGVLHPSPNSNTPKTVTTVTVEGAGYKDVANDTKWSALTSLVSVISGSIWTVDYYSQVLDTDSPLTPQATSVSGAYQQYRKVSSLQLKVTDPLKEDQDEETKMMQVDGSAIIYAGLIPNEGDMFTADIGVGKKAIFRVTTTKKLAYFKEAAYEIGYAVAGTHEEDIHDLEQKTVQELVFKKDFLVHGQEPVIEVEAASQLSEIEEVTNALTKNWLESFFSNEFKTLTVGGQDFATYDHFSAKFATTIISAEEFPLIQQVRILNVDDDLTMQQRSIWDALLSRQPDEVDRGFTKIGLVYTSSFSGTPRHNGIRYTGIPYVVYPRDPKIGVRGLRAHDVKRVIGADGGNPLPHSYPFYDFGTLPLPELTAGGVLELKSSSGNNSAYPSENLEAVLSNGAPQTTLPVPITGASAEGFYVFSQKFYSKATDQSVLENLVWQFLNRQPMDPIQLIKNAKIYHDWGVLEKYYFGLILILMLKAYVRDVQTW